MMITIIIILSFPLVSFGCNFLGLVALFVLHCGPFPSSRWSCGFFPLLAFSAASSILAANSSFPASEAQQCITGIFFFFFSFVFGLPPPRPKQTTDTSIVSSAENSYTTVSILLSPSDGIKEREELLFQRNNFFFPVSSNRKKFYGLWGKICPSGSRLLVQSRSLDAQQRLT